MRPTSLQVREMMGHIHESLSAQPRAMEELRTTLEATIQRSQDDLEQVNKSISGKGMPNGFESPIHSLLKDPSYSSYSPVFTADIIPVPLAQATTVHSPVPATPSRLRHSVPPRWAISSLEPPPTCRRSRGRCLGRPMPRWRSCLGLRPAALGCPR